MEEKYRIKSPTGAVLIVFEDHVTITQEGVMGALSRGLSGQKDLYYCDMSSIQFKNCGWTAGFMEFTFPGSNDRRGGAITGVSNENRFSFGRPTIGAAKKLAEEMEAVNAYIQTQWRNCKTNKSASVIAATSSADELMKFKQLLDTGAITEEEYYTKKKQLLNL